MPLYDFTCTKCGKVLEFLTSRDCQEKPCAAASSEEPKAPSGTCDGTMVRNIIQTGSSFSLKGTGWYVSDYKGR
jgi:predicted nucleic acid-binding Zn ribbon protein